MRARDAQLRFVEGLQPTQFGFGDEDAMVKHQSGGQIIRPSDGVRESHHVGAVAWTLAAVAPASTHPRLA